MLPQTTEYALRAVVHLGLSPNQPLTTATLSKSTGVPLPYLHKILRTLTKAELLSNIRGRHGGFRLARPADQLRLIEVIDAISPITRIKHCPLGLNHHEHQLCSLHERLDYVIQTIHGQFQNTTLADLIRSDLHQPLQCSQKRSFSC